jgi:hypothetical protein
MTPTDQRRALIDALEAGPTDGPWKKRKGFDGEIEIFKPDASLKRPYIAHQVCTIERDHKDARANIAFLLAANPAVIRQLLADLEAAERGAHELFALAVEQSILLGEYSKSLDPDDSEMNRIVQLGERLDTLSHIKAAGREV